MGTNKYFIQGLMMEINYDTAKSTGRIERTSLRGTLFENIPTVDDIEKALENDLGEDWSDYIVPGYYEVWSKEGGYVIHIIDGEHIDSWKSDRTGKSNGYRTNDLQKLKEIQYIGKLKVAPWAGELVQAYKNYKTQI